ncbi:MAG TPA: sigma-54 dependent transcriptional regulator [Vicinamibacterales bacterium]|nr:sigma-54 dependent transcriptional regulator [Vicinamibacterales bacterium]
MRAPQIAIADDDTAFANYLKTFLEARGYMARVYGHGEDLLAAARLGELPDVVLLDVMMPGMDGIATLRSLKTAHQDLQVIMLSGREHAQTIVEALNLGAVNYVVKPDDPDGLGEIALETAIKQAIEKRQLVSEVIELRRQVNDDQALAFWANSDEMRSIASIVDRVADSDVTVLIRGESGVGKELVARAIHDRSVRRNRPFVKVNCAAVPDDLLESELFGHEKGAFTGAASLRVGKFEHADGGTLMLDEIGEMKPQMQGKLLHVLQDGEFNRLGSNKRVSSDVRIVAATNRDLEAMLARSEFREDLYYRLKVIEIHVPPLRERQDEIPQLIEFFTAKYAKRYNRREPAMTPTLLDTLQNYSWPGNVRELENVIKRFVILQDEALLLRELQASTRRAQVAAATAAAAQEKPVVPVAAVAPAPADDAGEDEVVPPPLPPGENGHALPADGPQSLAEVARQAMLKAERELIIPTLRRVHWNRRKAAPLLGISYKTLLNKIKEQGIVQD